MRDYILYKIIDTDSGKFYIGATSKVEDFVNGKYNGTGVEWLDYYKEHENVHNFKRIILSYYEDKKSLYEAEKAEILKHCIVIDNKLLVNKSTGCMNKKIAIQGIVSLCEECGSMKSSHKKTCSKYKNPVVCSECGGTYSHKIGCSKFKVSSACSECGGKRGHHKKGCHFAVICEECKGTSGNHKSSCSKCKTCKECGGKNGNHIKGCSKRKNPKECEYCHKKGHSRHKEWCIYYKEIKSCDECNGKAGSHYSWCSKFKRSKCSECNGRNGHHYKSCSKYKDNRS